MEIEPIILPIIQGADKKSSQRPKMIVCLIVKSVPKYWEHNSEVKWMKWKEKDQKWPQESKSFQLSAPVVLCTQQCETHSAQNHQQTPLWNTQC